MQRFELEVSIQRSTISLVREKKFSFGVRETLLCLIKIFYGDS